MLEVLFWQNFVVSFQLSVKKQVLLLLSHQLNGALSCINMNERPALV